MALKETILEEKSSGNDEKTIVVDSLLVNEPLIKVESSNEDISDKNSALNSQNESSVDEQNISRETV